METEHEKMLQIAIKEMKLQGYRVIRLDRRIVPDAIAINEKEIVVRARPMPACRAPAPIFGPRRRTPD